jgi:hypothetical protein
MWLAAILYGHASPAHAEDHQSPQYPRAGKISYGVLGGVPVAIPWHLSELLEYDALPPKGLFGGKQPSLAERSIKSFGFAVRYPEMRGKDTPERIEDFQRRKVATSLWLRTVVISGSIHNGPGSANRIAAGRLKNTSPPLGPYVQQPHKEFDLEVFHLKASPGVSASSIYIHKAGGELAETYIMCEGEAEFMPCKHHFALEPQMAARVTVHYRRSLLKEWREIQKGVTSVISDFSIKKG